MPDPAPLQPDRFYHLFNRGNAGEDLFREPRNYPYFLELYQHHIHPIASTFAYCLMRNHFHLLIKIRGENEIAQHLTGFRNLSGVNQSRVVASSFQICSMPTQSRSTKHMNALAICLNDLLSVLRLIQTTTSPT